MGGGCGRASDPDLDAAGGRASGLAAAEAARRLAGSDPSAAAAAAEAVLQAWSGDPEVTAVALRALALATKYSAGAPAASRLLHRAVRVAERAGLARRAAEARMSLVVLYADQGDPDAALAAADLAAPALRGVDAGRLLTQRGLVLQRLGRSSEALDCYRRAWRTVRRDPDPAWQVRTLVHRGILRAYLGQHRAAEADLTRGAELAATHGLDVLLAAARQNLGFAALRRGDLPTALALVDEAITVTERVGGRTATALVDRAEVLLAAGLPGEARPALAAATDRLDREGYRFDLAEALLLRARAELLDGDLAAARGSAGAAAHRFRRQRRPGWALLAADLDRQARWAGGERSARLAGEAAEGARRLAAAGLTAEAAHSRVLAAQVLLHRGRALDAERLLGDPLPGVGASARREGPAQLRVTAWHGEALRRLARGDRRGARAALRAGLAVVGSHAASLGATDLRAHAAGHGEELAALGLRLALQDRDPRAVLGWAERYRARTLRHPAVRPPEDSRLAADLTALRQVAADLARTAAEGGDLRRLRSQQVRLEAAVRDRSRHAPGSRTGPDPGDLVAVRTELVAQLGRRVLVEYVRGPDTGLLHAVVVAGGRVRLHDLGRYDEALAEQEALRFALHRLARRHGSAASLAAARQAAAHAAARLDAQLLAPLRASAGGWPPAGGLVLAPTMALHALPWSTLPSLVGQPVTTVPSAAVWLATRRRDAQRRAAPGRTVLVAGPGLTHAAPEVRALRRRYPQAEVLTGAAATVDAVRRALDGAALAHVAAHGQFRADNPLFSSLQLADGPLTVYDLERLTAAPRRLVLSACEGALSAVRPGDELMGFAAAVLALGTTTLVAAVTAVDDADTRRLMLALHATLAAGAPPATALAQAQARTQVPGFGCFGLG